MSASSHAIRSPAAPAAVERLLVSIVVAHKPITVVLLLLWVWFLATIRRLLRLVTAVPTYITTVLLDIVWSTATPEIRILRTVFWSSVMLTVERLLVRLWLVVLIPCPFTSWLSLHHCTSTT